MVGVMHSFKVVLYRRRMLWGLLAGPTGGSGAYWQEEKARASLLTEPRQTAQT